MKKLIIFLFLLALAATGTSTCFAAGYDSVLRGDANNDGIVNISDVTTIQRHVAEMELIKVKGKKLAADVNGDETISISDATSIQEYLAEYGNPLKIGNKIYYEEYELPFIPSN